MGPSVRKPGAQSQFVGRFRAQDSGDEYLAGFGAPTLCHLYPAGTSSTTIR